jgi:hypothetical protein
MATPATDTELREVLNAVSALTQRVEIGFANVDAKFAQVDTKLSEFKAEIKAEIQRVEAKTDVKLAQLEGKIDVIDERTKLGFWGFIGRAVIVSVLGTMALLAIKYALTGTIKLT